MTAEVCCQTSDNSYMTAEVCSQMSDNSCMTAELCCRITVITRLILYVILYIYIFYIRCHFYTRILSVTKIEISRVGDFVRSYYQPLGFFFLSFDYILFQSFLPLTLPSFTPIGLKLGGRVLSYINYIGMPVATCLGLESGMSSVL